MTDQQAKVRKIRAFLDANILYSAATGSGVLRLWRCDGVLLVSSEYAISEAWENLESAKDPAASRDSLLVLTARIEIVAHYSIQPLSTKWVLPDPNDIPILNAAIASRCDYLITGDKKCFGDYFDRIIEGVCIVRPAIFLQRFGERSAQQ